MLQIPLARPERAVSGIAQVALGHHPKRADSGQRPTVVAIQFVPVLAVEDDLALQSARQLDTVEEHVAWIDLAVARIPIAIADVLITVTRVVLFAIGAGTSSQFDPRHLDVANVVVAVTWIEIVEHRFTSGTSRRGALARADEPIMESR